MQALGAGTLSIVYAAVKAMDGRAAARRSTEEARRSPLPPIPRRSAHDNVQKIDGSSGLVYFDYCSLVWVSYSKAVAGPLHLLAGLIAMSAMVVAGVTLRQLLAELGALVAAFVAAASMGLFLTLCKPLATFGSESLAIALFSQTSLAASLVAREAWLGLAAVPAGRAAAAPPPQRVSSGVLARRLGAASLGIWLLLLGGFQALGIGSAYLGALFCAVNGIGLLLSHVLAARPVIATTVQLVAALLPCMHWNGIGGWLLQVYCCTPRTRV